MDLTTPSKNQSSSSSTSLSQFEDSPVFNYINNLSPIDLVKSINIDPTLNSLAFASPPSVFASPQLSSHRDTTRFLIKRLQSSDLLKTEVVKSKDDNAVSKEFADGGKLSDLCADRSFPIGSSDKNVNIAPPTDEELELAIELPKGLRCDCNSPDANVVPLVGTASTDSEPALESNGNERRVAYMCEKDLRKISRLRQVEDEGEGDWVALISDATDILTFDSSTIEEDSERQKMVDPGTISFVSNVLQIPQDNASDLKFLETTACVDSCNAMGELVEFEEHKEDQVQPTFSGTLLNEVIAGGTTPKADLNGKNCCQSGSGCKNKIRRRCLVFEMMGAHKKKPVCHSNGGSSASSQSNSESSNVEKYSTPGKTGKANKLCMLSGKGFGLHLNSLATMTNDGKSVKIEARTSGDKQPNPDLVPNDKEDGIMENAIQTSTGSEDYGISSPKTKRHKIEHVGASCKRCNCKRSKCLKLYCECFAAGLYCIEPCSCQDCFNKPAHEDTVLETRKQIESRNPLAFAPKVIMSTDSFSDFGDETNKTPASARHKRGCNCKKSSCLKKYCECFQGGVGCSSSCRCEGCKNTFGTKNGVEVNDGQESEACDKDASDITLKHVIMKHGDDEHPDHRIHSDNARPSIQPPIMFSQHFSETSRSAIGPSMQILTGQKLRANLFCRQPKFETQLQAIPEDETPDILTGKYSPTNGVKSTSPNCKRVSPPHQESGSLNPWKNTRKLILRSVPPFPSLSSPSQQ